VTAHNRLLTINPEQPPTVHNGFVWQRCRRLGDCGITASEILVVPGTKLDVPAGLDDFGCSRPVSVHRTSSGRQWNETLLLCPFWSRNGSHIIPPRFETPALKGNERLWHCSAMKWVIFGLLIFSAFARADERTDRLAIERIVDAPNDYKSGAGQQQVSTLFTADAENQLSLLSELNQKLIPGGKPWSEVTKARIALHSIRFITPDVALVDAANTQYGSTILVRRVPVLLIMKRETNGWRIASVRVMIDLGSLR
jgi:hypothetical protein